MTLANSSLHSGSSRSANRILSQPTGAGLRGLYVFADYLDGEEGDFTGKIWTLRYDGQTASDFTDITADLFSTRRGNYPLLNPTSFGDDDQGELHLADFGGGIGNVYQIVRGR